MPDYIIVYNIGFGETADVVCAENEAEAQKLAYEAALEAFEVSAMYWVEEYNAENCNNYEIDYEEEE